MKDEIKYRAYQFKPSYKRPEGMYLVESLHFYDSDGGGEAFLIQDGKAESSEFFNDIALMQKYGEFWEGDVVEGIIEMGTAGRRYGDKPMRFEVVKDTYGIKLKEVGRPRYFDPSHIVEKKVLGNVYENPELLEVKVEDKKPSNFLS